MGVLKIYQSSAGSGKTYTLVREYLLLIFSKPAFLKSTLAITFTNDATGEMKERIIYSLWQLSRNENKKLAEDIIEALQLSGSVQEMATEALQFILHHYPDFSISTIDSFFLNITKAIARELGLPGKYDVDLNRDAAIDFMVSRLLLSIGENKELTDWLEDFAYDRMEDEKGWNMQAELKKISGELFKDKYRDLKEEYTEPIDKNAIKELRKQTHVFEEKIKNLGQQFFEMATSAGAEISDFHYGKTGFAAAMKKFAQGGFPMGYEFSSRFNEAVDTGNLFAKKAATFLHRDAHLNKDLHELLKETKSYFENNLRFYLSANATLKVIYLSGILNFLDDELKNYRHEHNVMLISDTNKLLSTFITDTDTPFIYEKVGNTYRNFLVDEFQDTSQSQWKNMLPLLENSLSDGHTVLTVGDVKQSIYRWRGGDMKLLLTEVKRQLGRIAQRTLDLKLDNNYRSSVAVINFNNSLFSLIPELTADGTVKERLLELAYEQEKVKQTIIKKDVPGFVQIELVSKDAQPMEVNYAENVSDSKKIFLGKALGIINNQLKLGYKLGDMVLLVRNNQEGNDLADFLVLNGIEDIISRDSLLIQSAPQVTFLISAFRWLNDVKNEVAVKHIEWFGETSLKLEQEYLTEQFFNRRNYYLSFSLQELTGKLIEVFKLNKNPDAFIQRFEDLIIEKANDDCNDLSAFLQWWDAEIERRKISVQIPGSEKAITIMTIHRSKGLQFPIVIMPFTNWNLGNGNKGNIWVKPEQEPFNKLGVYPVNISSVLEKTIFKDEYLKEEEDKFLEEVNALYVALTRSEEKLFLMVEEKKENKLTKAGDIISRALQVNEDFAAQFDIDGKVYQMGDDRAKVEKKEMYTKEASPVEAESIQMQKYLVNDALSEIGFKIKKYGDDEEQKLALFGITAHDMLAGYLTENDLPLVQQKLNALTFDPAEKEKLKTEVDFAVQTINKNQWTNADFTVKAECDMTDGTGLVVRPDRLMLKDKQAIVLDYKTGGKNSKHMEQVLDYKNVLNAAGFSEVKTYLLYLELQELVEVI